MALVFKAIMGALLYLRSRCPLVHILMRTSIPRPYLHSYAQRLTRVTIMVMAIANTIDTTSSNFSTQRQVITLVVDEGGNLGTSVSLVGYRWGSSSRNEYHLHGPRRWLQVTSVFLNDNHHPNRKTRETQETREARATNDLWFIVQRPLTLRLNKAQP